MNPSLEAGASSGAGATHAVPSWSGPKLETSPFIKAEGTAASPSKLLPVVKSEPHTTVPGLFTGASSSSMPASQPTPVPAPASAGWQSRTASLHQQTQIAFPPDQQAVRRDRINFSKQATLIVLRTGYVSMASNRSCDL